MSGEFISWLVVGGETLEEHVAGESDRSQRENRETRFISEIPRGLVAKLSNKSRHQVRWSETHTNTQAETWEAMV